MWKNFKEEEEEEKAQMSTNPDIQHYYDKDVGGKARLRESTCMYVPATDGMSTHTCA